MESKQLHSIIGIWTNACRFLLAAVFIFSGFVKAVDPLGTQYKIQDYLEVFGWAASVPAFLPFLASVLQAMVEFCLGVYLLFGIRRRMTTLFVVLIMGVMTPLTLWLALSNPISDCGCFGDAVTLTNWETFGKNVLLLIAAVSVFKWGNRITPLVTKRFDWLVAMYTFLYISGMTLYCYRELPVFDFRPYHIGADIRKGMEIPEGEKPTVYETRFILQKDGVEKEFTLENYPDSTWTFVDSKTMVKEQGYEPPIHDFSIIRQEDGEDITDEVLDDDNYTFLLVAHQLSQADDSTIDLINELYDYSVEHGYQFYCLTSSPDSDIEDWQERTGAEYPFCLMDDITLKTMIRSNPGLMLLKNGVVINKWSVAADKPNCDVVICTPFIHLASVTPIVDKAVIGIGAENCADKVSGAYTGEVSAEMVASTGAEYVILGHSERRAYYHETVEILEEKVKLALANNLKPIFCIGEVLEEREANKQNEVVAAQLASVFSLSAEDFSKIILAYEPVWAIGTGKTATAEQAQEIHAFIRSLIADKYGKEVADNTSILYGGSCKPSNAKELFANPDVDGGLIGGAALKVVDFKGIIDAFK